jgi:hypothetical protein
MTKALLNPKTGIVDNPIHPCYKAPDKGLCKMRVDDELKFECAQDPKYCRYLSPKKKEKEGG